MKKTQYYHKWQYLSTLLISCTMAFGQSGNLNSSFGTNGFRLTTVTDQNNTQASTYNILINENADTYSIIGLEGNIVVYKRDGDGLAVPNYGDAGFSDHFSFGDKANCLLADGSVLMAGNIGLQASFMEQNNPGNLVLGKLNKYGKWDQQFAPNGLKTLFQLKHTLQPIGIGVIAGGKILVVLKNVEYQDNKLVLVTLLPSGDIDPSLPDNGQLVLPFGEALETISVSAFLQQPDKKWILGVTEHPTTGGNPQNYLVRLDADGKPDAGFGTGGIKNLDSWLAPEILVAVGCKKEGGYTLLTSNTGNTLTLRIAHFTKTGIPDPAKGGVSATPVNLPFSTGFRAASFDEYNRFSLLVAEEPANSLNQYLVRLDANGKPDPTFNNIGYMPLQQFNSVLYTGLAITPKKNLMVLGNSYTGALSFLLQKILAKGQPDPFYDGDGAVTVNYPYTDFKWTNLLKVSDTRMLAGGFVRKGGKPYWLIEAVTAQGKSDPGFANGGILYVPLPDNVHLVNMELTRDNQVIVYGTMTTANIDQVFLYKFFGDGRRDISWASNGQKLLTTGRSVNSIRLKTQKDGKLLVVYGFYREDAGGNGSDISIQRLLVNGDPDKSFAYSGSRIIDVEQNFDIIGQLSLQADGKILLIVETIIGESRFLSVVRLLPDGKYDPAYQQGLKKIPVATTTFNTNNVTLRADNTLLIAGTQHSSYYQSSAALLLLTANGQVDARFAGNGIYLNPFSIEQAAGIDVSEQPDGKLLFTCRDFGNNLGEIINLRLSANGQPDPGFGMNGVSQVSYASGPEDIYLAKIFPGQLVMAGNTLSPVSKGMLVSIQLNNTSLPKVAAITAFNDLRIYPNPAKDHMTMQWNAKSGHTPKTVALYDIDGKLLQVWPAQYQLPLNHHPAGNYVLRIIFTDGSTRQEKIVIAD